MLRGLYQSTQTRATCLRLPPLWALASRRAKSQCVQSTPVELPLQRSVKSEQCPPSSSFYLNPLSSFHPQNKQWTRIKGNEERKATEVTWSQSAYEVSSNAGKAILQAGLRVTDFAARAMEFVPAAGSDRHNPVLHRPSPSSKSRSLPSSQGIRTLETASANKGGADQQRNDGSTCWSAYFLQLTEQFTAPKTGKIKLQ